MTDIDRLRPAPARVRQHPYRRCGQGAAEEAATRPSGASNGSAPARSRWRRSSWCCCCRRSSREALPAFSMNYADAAGRPLGGEGRSGEARHGRLRRDHPGSAGGQVSRRDEPPGPAAAARADLDRRRHAAAPGDRQKSRRCSARPSTMPFRSTTSPTSTSRACSPTTAPSRRCPATVTPSATAATSS